jgi:hypothetical protein
MKPAWDKLMAAFADSKTALVADCDCTAACKPLCDSNGVRGFPSIKYGDPADLQDYNGGRDYDALKAHADENLGPSCGPKNLDLCSDAQKTEIEDVMKLSDDEIDEKIASAEKAMEDAETTFKSEVEKLQKNYEGLTKAKDDAIAEVKKAGLGVLKQVKASKAKGKDEL